jgi:hypothetical protein
LTVSLNFREAAYAQSTGEVVICLITISHTSLTDDIRISTDPTERLYEYEGHQIYGTTSRGKEYLFFPASIKLPDDTDDGPRNMRIEFDNVGREYMETIRAIVGHPKVNTEIVLSSDVDTVEASWPEFLITSITYDAATVTAHLAMETLEREPCPAMSFDPSRAPGLF